MTILLDVFEGLEIIGNLSTWLIRRLTANRRRKGTIIEIEEQPMGKSSSI